MYEPIEERLYSLIPNDWNHKSWYRHESLQFFTDWATKKRDIYWTYESQDLYESYDGAKRGVVIDPAPKMICPYILLDQ